MVLFFILQKTLMLRKAAYFTKVYDTGQFEDRSLNGVIAAIALLPLHKFTQPS